MTAELTCPYRCNFNNFGYVVYERRPSGTWQRIASENPTDANSFSVTVQRESGTYDYKASVQRVWYPGGGHCCEVQEADSGSITVVVNKVTAPRTPALDTIAPAIAPDGKYLLSWSKPSNSTIDYYLLQESKDGAAWTDIPLSTNAYDTESEPRPAGSTYRYRVAACNNAAGCSGYSNVQSVAVPVNEPPQVTLESPTDGVGFRPGDKVTLRASAVDQHGVESVDFYIRYTIGGTVTTDTRSASRLSGNSWVANWDARAADQVLVWAKARDVFDAEKNSSTILINVTNNQPPTASLSVDKTVLAKGDSVTLTSTASDSDGSIDKVRFTANGGTLAEIGSKPYTYTWTPEAVDSYDLQAIAFDNESAIGASSAINIQVSTAPSVTLEYPAGGEVLRLGEEVMLKARASDDGSIASLHFYSRYSGGTQEELGAGVLTPGECAGAGQCYTLLWTPAVADDKVHLWVQATDNLNLTGLSAESLIALKANDPPSVSLQLSDTDIKEGDTLQLTAAASDADGSVAQVEFFVNGSSLGVDVNSPYTKSWTAPAAGSYQFTARATDNDGDSRLSDAVTVNVAVVSIPTKPPALEVNNQSDNLIDYTGYYTLSWSNVANASTYRLTENGDEVQNTNTLSFYAPNQNAGDYRYEVQACNFKGCSEPSNVISVSVVLDTPSAPTDLLIEPAENVTGNYTLSWPANETRPNPTHYQLEEKAGGLEADTEWQAVGGGQLLKRTRTDMPVGRYTYQVKACNPIGCSEAGVQRQVEVLPPYLSSAALACDGGCLLLAGIGLDPGAQVTLNAVHDGAISATVNNLGWQEGPQLQVPLENLSVVYDALFELGLNVTLQNPNGAEASIRVYGDHETASLSLTDSAPTVGADGTIYVGSGNAVYAVDPATGKNRGGWPFSTGGEVRAKPVVDGVDGTIYAASRDHNLYAITPSGNRKWLFGTGGPLLSSPVLDSSRTLYQGSMDGTLYAINAINGTAKWQYATDGQIQDSPVLAGDSQGTIYFTTTDGRIHALGRGILGPDVLVWDSQDDSLLASDLDNRNWQPSEAQRHQYLRVARLYRLLLQPPLSLNKESLTFWTYALVNRASLEEVANAFLSSNTGQANFPSALSNAGFVDALYARAFPNQGQPAFNLGGVTYTRAMLLTMLGDNTSRASMAALFADANEYASANDAMLSQSFDYYYQPQAEWPALGCEEVDELLRDCDGDGLPDWWEILFFGSIEGQTGDDDSDGSGMSNRDAFLAGLDACTNGCSQGVVAESMAPGQMPEVPQLTAAISDQVGSSDGEFRVNESGAATYSLPIALPAGTAGVVPSLSVDYSSQGGNGLLGKGWRLSGLSAISRCRQTPAQDGQFLPITWSSEDRFCLDGQRLVVVEGEYGAVNSRYRTEIDSFALVTAQGGRAGHPEYFTVERKDGSLSYYGKSTGSRKATEDGKVLTWAQSRFEDSVGNGIDYDYRTDGGLRIDSIRYADGAAQVDFEYTDRLDVRQGYVSGYSFVNNKRLERIEVNDDSRLLRSYKFNFPAASTDFSSTSYLQSIEECAILDGMETCRPATRFDWTLFEHSVDPELSSSVALGEGEKRVLTDYRPADINGDGRMDFLWQELEWTFGSQVNQRWSYVLATEGGFGRKRTAASTRDVSKPYRTEVFDYNADGRADLAYYDENRSNWSIYLSRPSGEGTWSFSSTRVWDVDLPEKNLRFIDLNGDGLVDALGDDGYRLMEPDPTKDPSRSSYYRFGDKETITPPELEPWEHDGWEETNRRYDDTCYSHESYFAPDLAGDFNGDGRVNLVLVDVEIERQFVTRGGRRCFGMIQQHTRAYLVTLDGDSLINHGKLLDVEQSSRDFDEEERSGDAVDRHAKLKHKLHAADLNGDGMTDLVIERRKDNIEDGADYSYRFSKGQGSDGKLQLAEEVFIDTLPEKANIQLVDYNHDGAADLVWFESGDLMVRRWEGGTLGAPYFIATDVGIKDDTQMMADITGDGRLDRIRVAKSRLDGDNSYRINTYQAAESGEPLNVITAIHNGLGARTDIHYGTLATSHHYARREVAGVIQERCEPSYHPDTGYNPDPSCEEYTVADSAEFYAGLNGDWELPEGNLMLDKSSPVLEVMGSMQVVTRVSGNAPALDPYTGEVDAQAQSHIGYYYGQARSQAEGRGMLGFRYVSTVDEQTGVTTTTEYRQDFPFIGVPLRTEVKTEQGHLLSEAENRWGLQGCNLPLAGVATCETANQPYQPFIAQSVERRYELLQEGQIQGELLQTVTTDNVYDTSGNPLEISTTTEGGGKTFTKEVTNIFGPGETLNFHNQYERGLSDYDELGRLTATTVTRRRALRGEMDESVRRSSFTYYQSGVHAGLLETETVEPEGAADETLTTTYDYDTYGNQTSVTQTIIQDGQERTRSEHAEYEDGRYRTRSINAYDQVTEEVLERNAWGQPTKVRDLTGQVAQAQYSPFGRKIVSYSPDGAWSQTLMAAAGHHCPAVAVSQSRTTRAGGSESINCFDVLGRKVREAGRTFEGGWTYVDTQYDRTGRVVRKSEPHDGYPQYWTEMAYDLLDRVVSTELPGVAVPVQVTYDGFTTTTTNPKHQTKKEVSNALGERVEVEDAMEGQLHYHYDAQGNLRFVIRGGPEVDDVETEVRYDRLGRKTYMNDPDKGKWRYTYNAFGDLIEQRDAKGQRSEMKYDDLGRRVERSDYLASSELEGQSNWHYNNTQTWQAAEFDNPEDSTTWLVPPGALIKVEASDGYRQAQGYDNLGRPSVTATSLMANGRMEHYFARTTYDSIGRVHQEFDAGGDGSWQDNGIENRYNEYGYLREVVDAVEFNGAPRSRYYQVLEMDLRGNVTRSRQGNGITTERSYYSATGRLRTQRADLFNGLFGELQDKEYEWDELGNLIHRYDYHGEEPVQEDFGYDELNRLKWSKVSGREQVNVDYDALGNI
ncbi:Ig-like domain-containing protein, partial [Marinimicrobium sp. ARAG 43.8]|uniref:Ig-like domain-containing protein n=1 Tax=Marinimicrobium sp. ARAG 43.8 TaxID=3418719 RepID=UPI003CF99AC8